MLILDTLAELPAFLVALLAPPLADASAAAAEHEMVSVEHDLDELYIEGVTANGSGCVDESKYSVVVDSDKNSFMIIYNDMKLENPNQAGDALQSKNCLVSVSLHIPGGFQIAMARVVSRGNATLAEEVTARATSRYWFAGERVGGVDRVNLAGPFDDVYEYYSEVPFDSLVWSPCGEPGVFALDNHVLLNATKNPAGASEITLIDTDVGFSQIVYWKFQECGG